MLAKVATKSRFIAPSGIGKLNKGLVAVTQL